MMDHLEIILLIQAHINTKIAKKWVIDSHSHLILRLISSKSHSIKSHIHYECHHHNIDLKQIMELKAMIYNGMNV
jgi:hypothetical protein